MSMMLEDATVIRSFKSGNRRVFHQVVVEYRPELVRHARRSVSDAATAEDLVQETFIRAYRAFDRLADDSHVRPWLHQILANLCVDEANRCRREHDKSLRAAFELAATRPSLGPEDQLGLNFDDTSLGAALAGLSKTHRDALEKRFVEELDYDEIADSMGVSETNVRARVSRARATLRRALQGVAVIPVAAFVMFRRPDRGALAAPSDPGSPAAASSAAGNAGRLATTLAPAIEAANSVAATAPSSVPLLTKAAIGVGAVAVTFSAAPERPVERPPAIEVEEAAPIATDAPVVITTPTVVVVAEAPRPVVSAPPPAPPSITPETSIPTTAAALTDEPVTIAPVVATPATTVAPETTIAPETTVAPTTVPETTVPSTTEAVAVLPPLTGGSLQSSVSITPAGPRLDLGGGVMLTIAGSSEAGLLSGRVGIDEPDPAGARRIDGTISLQLGSGTIELRLAGYGTSSEAPVAGTAPTSLSMSGVYRASGATGQLLTSGSFSGSLSAGSLSLTLAA